MRRVSAVLWTAEFSSKGLPGFDVMIAVTIFWWRSLARFEAFHLPTILGEWSSSPSHLGEHIYLIAPVRKWVLVDVKISISLDA